MLLLTSEPKKTDQRAKWMPEIRLELRVVTMCQVQFRIERKGSVESFLRQLHILSGLLVVLGEQTITSAQSRPSRRVVRIDCQTLSVKYSGFGNAAAVLSGQVRPQV